MTRSIQKSNHTAISLDAISANMLGYTASFASSHFCLAYVVQQRSLSMIDVTHHSHYRSTRQQSALVYSQHRFKIFLNRVLRDSDRRVAKFFNN